MSDLPPLVGLDERLRNRHRSAHERLHAVSTSAGPVVGMVSRHIARRLLTEGLANVQPVFGDVGSPLLIPPPRRFLHSVASQRLAGARAAFRYVDSALTMATMPGGRPVIQSTTPSALNALLAGPVTERETNAGLIRVTPTNWMPDANAFEHPPSDQVGELLDGAVVVAADESHPAVERAAWFAFVTMTIHPFVDGNGRTARALFLATAGTDLPGEIDWGVLDQWHLAREPYVRALQAGQRASRYSGSGVDPAPFVGFAATASARGAEVGLARVELLASAVEAVPEFDDGLVLRVLVDRFVTYDELLAEPDDPSATLGRIGELVAAGVLHVARAGPGADRFEVGARGLVIGERLLAPARRLRQARYVGVADA